MFGTVRDVPLNCWKKWRDKTIQKSKNKINNKQNIKNKRQKWHYWWDYKILFDVFIKLVDEVKFRSTNDLYPTEKKVASFSSLTISNAVLIQRWKLNGDQLNNENKKIQNWIVIVYYWTINIFSLTISFVLLEALKLPNVMLQKCGIKC